VTSSARAASVDVHGVRSPVIEAGRPQGREAAVFVHGVPGSRLDWQDLVERVGEFGRAVALDMPGFGDADKPRRWRYRVEDYAAHLGGALDELGIERAHVVVHDFGGAWTWAWAAREPERLASVVAMNTGLMQARRWHATARRWRRPLAGELSMALVPYGGFAKALTQGGRAPLPEPFLRRMHKHFDRGTRRAILRLYRATDQPYPPAQQWIDALAGRGIPALVVWGDQDRFISTKGPEGLQRMFPAAQVVRLPGSGHFVFADAPVEVAAAVLPFLREHLAASEAA
jgi:pimeloyl-ACP methyl ester carboxylesterase